EWIDIRWELNNAPWLSEEMRRIDLNLSLITYFFDRKRKDKVLDNFLMAITAKILSILARLHWRHKKFRFCPEFRLIEKLATYKVNSETK
ncbi:MAG: hypothetical protein NT033_06770, partial [Candidatus Omnitrophica bacterium]|nr:hypothetical protein [Candidatus Omnitrophota bacterium]